MNTPNDHATAELDLKAVTAVATTT